MKYYRDIQCVGAARILMREHCPIAGTWPDFYSLQFDRSGELFYEVDGKQAVRFSTPAIYLTRPYRRYRFGSTEPGVWDHSWLGFSGSRATRIFEEGFCMLSETDSFPIHRPHDCAALFDRMIALFERDDGRRHEPAILLEQLLGFLIENQESHRPQPAFAEAFHGLREQIEADPFADWDFAELARSFSMSYSYFRRLFRAHLHRSPHDYLLSARMRRAAGLLQETSLSVQEVGYLACYDDPSRFSKVFKQQIGLSPRQFRNSLRLG